MKSIQIIVFGSPVPQGSMRAFMPKGWNRPILTSDNPKLKGWRQEIAGAASDAMRKQKLSVFASQAIAVICEFYFDRPKSLKKSVRHKITRPDADKCARSVLDALTGTVYKDDAQVISLHVVKEFSDEPRAEIQVQVEEEL